MLWFVAGATEPEHIQPMFWLVAFMVMTMRRAIWTTRTSNRTQHLARADSVVHCGSCARPFAAFLGTPKQALAFNQLHFDLWALPIGLRLLRMTLSIAPVPLIGSSSIRFLSFKFFRFPFGSPLSIGRIFYPKPLPLTFENGFVPVRILSLLGVIPLELFGLLLFVIGVGHRSLLGEKL